MRWLKYTRLRSIFPRVEAHCPRPCERRVVPARMDGVGLTGAHAACGDAADQQALPDSPGLDEFYALHVGLYLHFHWGVPEDPPARRVLRGKQGQPDHRDLRHIDTGCVRDRLEELRAHELELGLRERQRDVDAHRLAVGAGVARVAPTAELGHAARDGARVRRAGLDVARRLAEAVARADRAVGHGLQAGAGGKRPQRAERVPPAALAVERRGAGLAHTTPRV